ncbi:uncharacterized protein LOC105219525 isoform X1 [Zeugodacus cucurbitae]|uniref:Leucine-rich repeat-containing protein C10orf11 homolog n=2 Tax=Zeugodacus cucurbitae TaxID=28588 RepID=A0A0A1XDI7_ZEUCU|nr:uncharacterized protein LOC105219525 isoform X1 [Zeugodacus cucurbitae]
MSDATTVISQDTSECHQLFEVIKSCVSLEFYEDQWCYGDDDNFTDFNFYFNKQMISSNEFNISGNISTNSFASDDFGDSILEENGRISLAYENLRTIPQRIAVKFATHTKFLDLSCNQFQNLSFLSFFNELDTLILDHNCNLDSSTLPFLPNLKILWINNCNIYNLDEWMERIQSHCPLLEHLSVMGNPVANKDIVHTITSTPKELSSATSSKADYREYILNAMPFLKSLDGIERSNNLSTQKEIDYTFSSSYGNSQSTSSNSNNLFPKDERSQQMFQIFNLKKLFQLSGRRKKIPSSTI